MAAFGPTSCALGPYATGTQNAKNLCKESFISATIYYPHPNPTSAGPSLLASIVIVGGWSSGEQNLAAWGPFYASHGIVAMTIGTPTPWKDAPAARCRALIDASLALQSEHEREGSALQGRLDVSRRAVQGHSLGGGGAQLAGLNDQTLKCVIALCPDDAKIMGLPAKHTLSFPSDPPRAVPVLIICGENDKEANTKKNAWPHYEQTGAPKLFFEVRGGDHYVANGPAGGYDVGEKTPCYEANGIIACGCMMCGCPNECWCGPCPRGTLDGSSGHATAQSSRGAIGGVALAWLRLFLLDDESARSQLATRPDIASGFECSGVADPMTMAR